MQFIKKNPFRAWLFDEVTDEEIESGGKISQIPIHSIKPNPYQPRREFDMDSIDELAESIKNYGLLQPVTVRQIYNGEYELVAGERRLRACGKAGMLKIPAIVTKLSDNDSAVVALLENIQRCNLSFMEEAQAYRNLLYHHGLTQEELAQKLGKNQSSVANKVRLLKLSKAIREIISENELTERHARALLRLDSESEQIKALEKICDDKLNVKQTDELIETMLQNEAIPKPVPMSIIKTKPLKDMRIFTNTIRHAVELMRRQGIDAVSTETDYDTHIEYVITVPKCADEEKIS